MLSTFTPPNATAISTAIVAVGMPKIGTAPIMLKVAKGRVSGIVIFPILVVASAAAVAQLIAPSATIQAVVPVFLSLKPSQLNHHLFRNSLVSWQ